MKKLSKKQRSDLNGREPAGNQLNTEFRGIFRRGRFIGMRNSASAHWLRESRRSTPKDV
jgi:hypothetical protein